MVGGELILMCTSVAPASRNIRMIFWLVVPRTIESSTTTTRLPSSTSLMAFNLTLTPKFLMDCCGSMKVRPT